jgi:hypothetical protein
MRTSAILIERMCLEPAQAENDAPVRGQAETDRP